MIFQRVPQFLVFVRVRVENFHRSGRLRFLWHRSFLLNLPPPVNRDSHTLARRRGCGRRSMKQPRAAQTIATNGARGNVLFHVPETRQAEEDEGGGDEEGEVSECGRDAELAGDDAPEAAA